MEIIKDPKFDWLGMKWYFISLSAILIAAGVISLVATGGLGFSVDFTGGSLVYVKFGEEPDLGRIRSLLSGEEFRAEGITRFDDPSQNQVQIRMGQLAEGSDLGSEGTRIYEVLKLEFDADQVDSGKRDFNRLGRTQFADWLKGLGPGVLEVSDEGLSTDEVADRLASQVIGYRTQSGGLVSDFSGLAGLSVPEGVVSAMSDAFYLGSFTIISVESVGPKVGSELKDRARLAVTFSLIGMLIYIWFRFHLINGVAAIVALFHDVFITVGAFSLAGKELSLTVIAALLTLVGYSLNDTIVVFDRVRENQRLMRRGEMRTVINLSINQTLNRTILTSATFFMAAMALYIFGGDALNGFSFALVIGVAVGTYSSIAIASPIVVWWDEFNRRRKQRAR